MDNKHEENSDKVLPLHQAMSQPLLTDSKVKETSKRRVSFNLNHRYLEAKNPWDTRKCKYSQFSLSHSTQVNGKFRCRVPFTAKFSIPTKQDHLENVFVSQHNVPAESKSPFFHFLISRFQLLRIFHFPFYYFILKIFFVLVLFFWLENFPSIRLSFEGNLSGPGSHLQCNHS